MRLCKLLIIIETITLISTQQSGAPTPNATQPFWLINASYQNINTGKLPTSVDITIIGAGMSGSSIAYHLTKYLTNKTSILLLDSRGASGGATGRNAGGMVPSNDLNFEYTLNKYDNQTAINQYNWTLQGVYDMMDFIESNNLTQQTNLQYGNTITRFSNISQFSIRNSSINLMQSFGIGLDEKLLNKQQTQNLTNCNNNSYVGGVYSQICAEFWPSKVVFKLINLTIMNSNNTLHIDNENNINLNIQFHTTVHSVLINNDDHDKQRYIIETDRGNVISNIVIFATNAYSSYLLPQFTNLIIPTKLQIIISKPWQNGIIWNNLEGGIMDDFEYYNQRLCDDRILISGGFELIDNNWMGNYNDSYIDENVSNYLKQYLNNYYNDIKDNNGINIDMEWQGIFAVTIDGYPYIGPIPNMINAYICAGFNGYGLDQTFNAGKAISNMIIGKKPDPFLDIFLPQHRM